MSGTITGVDISVQYSVEAGYGSAANNYVRWALDTQALADTTIQPLDTQVDHLATYDLYAQGVDTFTEISTLDIEFTNNDGGGPSAVSFDYVWINITVANYGMDIEFTTTGVQSGDVYSLQLNYQANGENYDVLAYNGATWDDLGDLTSATMTAVSFSLTDAQYNSGNVRIRFVGKTETGDLSQSTLYIEYHRIKTHINMTNDLVFYGNLANENFGFSVSTAGNVDALLGDDVIVGAPGEDKAYVIFGLQKFYAFEEYTINGTKTGTYANTQSSDDSYEILKEGNNLHHKWNFTLSGTGPTRFFLEANHTVNSENDDFRFNYSTDDVTYIEMLIVTKTFEYDAYQAYTLPNGLTGSVYVEVEDTDRNPANTFQDSIFVDHMYIRKIKIVELIGTANSDFGWSVADAGNLNNDGSNNDDVVVGAPNAANNGRAYVFYGEGLNWEAVIDDGSWDISSVTANVTITGEANGDKFGYSVHGAGDMSDPPDGIDDIIIGAPYYGASDNGAVYIFNGSASLSSTISAANADHRNISYDSGSHFGWSVCKAGDLDDDGNNDVAIGAPHFDTTAPSMTDAGKGWIMCVCPIPEFSIPVFVMAFNMILVSIMIYRRKRRRYVWQK